MGWLWIHLLELGHDGLILLYHLVHVLRYVLELDSQSGDAVVLGDSFPQNMLGLGDILLPKGFSPF
jgi:hypothetical protein